MGEMRLKNFAIRMAICCLATFQLENLNSQINLVLPSQNFTVLQDSLFFSWSEMGDEDFFELQLDLTNGFSSPTTYTVVNSDTMISGLSVNQHFWRVRGYSSGVFGAWSSASTFHRIDLSAMGTLLCWLDAADLLALGNGSNVTQWTDKSTNNYNLTQTNPVLYPTLSTNVLGNFPAVNFSGTDQLSNFTATTIGAQFLFFTNNNSTTTAVAGINSGNAAPRFFCTVANSSITPLVSAAFSAVNTRRNLSSNLASPLGSYNLVSGFRTTPASIANYCLSPSNSPYVRLNGYMFEAIVYQSTLSAANLTKVENYLRCKYSPPVSLGKDIRVDYGYCATTITPSAGNFVSYLWSTGETTPTINVNGNGVYWLQTTDTLGIISSDTINVFYPDIDSPPANLFCPGNSVVWDTDLGPDYSYLWSTGELTESIVIDTAGTWNVIVTDSLGCQRTFAPQTFEIDDYWTTVSLGADTSLCAGNSIQLSTGAAETVSYLWSDMTVGSSVNVVSTGNVFVETTNINGCVANDTIFVTVTGQAPNIAFSTPIECLNVAMQFTDLSSNIISDPVVIWSWDFGDGETSVLQNPEHFYPTAGTYSVDLMVESQGGCSSFLTQNVEVRQQPSANFSSAGQCSENLIQFNNLSTPGTGSSLSYDWNFGEPGSGSSNFSSEINPSRTYNLAGIFDVTLVTSDEFGCSDTSIQAKTILQSPIANYFIGNHCVNTPFECLNTSIVEPFSTYLWTFDDFTSSISMSPYKVFTTSGEHEIELTVTGQNGCIDVYIDTIFINPNPIASFNLGPRCFGTYMDIFSAASISDGSIATNTWSINGGSPIVGDTIAHFVDLMGQNQLVLTSVSDQGCSNVANQFFFVTESFDASFSIPASIFSQGDTIEFINLTNGVVSSLWNFGDLTTSTETSPNHAYDVSYIDSTIDISLIAENASGCIDTAYNIIQIRFPSLDLELSELYVQEQNGSLILGALLKNKGTKIIEKIDFEVSSHTGQLFSESWSGVLLPESSFVHLFAGKPPVQSNPQDDFESYLCVKSKGYDAFGLQESFLDNNRECKNIENESVILFPIYPNPINDEFTLEFFVTKLSDVAVDLIDLNGKTVKNLLRKQQFEEGIYRVQANLDYIYPGYYFIRMTTNDLSLLREVIVD